LALPRPDIISSLFSFFTPLPPISLSFPPLVRAPPLLVVHPQVKLSKGQICGGAYLKLLREVRLPPRGKHCLVSCSCSIPTQPRLHSLTRTSVSCTLPPDTSSLHSCCALGCYAQDVDLENFDSSSGYTIMFGPDSCGSTSKVHLIVQHQSPVTKLWEEKHATVTAPVMKDVNSHLYTLVLRPDNSFEVLIASASSIH